jgi:hypothetical protein
MAAVAVVRQASHLCFDSLVEEAGFEPSLGPSRQGRSLFGRQVRPREVNVAVSKRVIPPTGGAGIWWEDDAAGRVGALAREPERS